MLKVKFKRRHHKPTFLELSRKKRADKTFEIRSLFNNTCEFITSYGDFIAEGIIDEKCNYADIYFLGKDRFTFYNATVLTAGLARHDAIRAWAYNQRPVTQKKNHRQIAELVAEKVADQNFMLVSEEVKLSKKYLLGIGTKIILPTATITPEEISRIITKFKDGGYQAYREDTPAPVDAHWFGKNPFYAGKPESS